MLLNNLDDIKCLRSLVLVSPSFHQIYLANRERVLTKATFRELQSRSRTMNIPSLIAVSEVGFKDDEPPPEELKSAINSIYDYFHKEQVSSPKKNPTKRGLVLSVAQCLALLIIEYLVAWELRLDPAWEFRLDPSDSVEDWEDSIATGSRGVLSAKKLGFALRCATVPSYDTYVVEP